MIHFTRNLQAWLDRRLISHEQEELEVLGLARHGREIIDELNRVYDSTGTLRRLATVLTPQIRLAHATTGKPVRILDVGTRDGSFLHLLRQLGETIACPLELQGTEFRPQIAQYARERCSMRGDPATIRCASVAQLGSIPANSFDIVCSSFVLHHRTREECVDLLAACSRAARFGAYHLDLRRSAVGLALTWTYFNARGFTHARHDAVLSVRRAFRPEQLNELLATHELPLFVRRLNALYLLVESKRQAEPVETASAQ
jgi:2-polyprenyl-3-methyl-5-hydroxy-6-metoxy-1,4-benzoquinol methylase